MSTTDEAAPPGTPGNAAAPADDAAPASAGPAPTDQGPPDTLSPAVRRLVRQFDLDITGIHGTGPDGRIRVGDVMALLGGRTDTGKRDAPPKWSAEPGSDEATLADDEGDDEADAPLKAAQPAVSPPSPPQPAAAAPPGPVATPAPTTLPSPTPTTTMFDCDVSRVLAHRRKLRGANVAVLLVSYFLVALAEAQHNAPELTGGAAARFGIVLTTADGDQRMARLDAAAAALGDSLESRLHAFDAALRQNLDTDTVGANLLVHHYGDSGSVLATPTPLGTGHAASVGIGRARREIVVRNVDGVESPRVTSRCYVSLSFIPDRVALHRANRFMVIAVHVLEHWPD